MKRLTRDWVEKAEEDFRVAAMVAEQRPPAHDAVCFHSQQAAEKYLKGLLQEHNVVFARTHNLVTLLSLVLPRFPAQFRGLRRGLDYLTRFAVDPRYPGLQTRKRQAVSALRWADKVRTVCRKLLGL